MQLGLIGLGKMGKNMRERIRRAGIDRSEVFIETKVWVSDYGYDQTLHAFDKARRSLTATPSN